MNSVILVLAVAALAAVHPARACSSFQYNLTAYNYAVSARTLDFEWALSTDLVTVKAGTVLSLLPVAGSTNTSVPPVQSTLGPFTSKYAVALLAEFREIGCIAFGVPLNECAGTTMDGLNSAGLSFGVQWDLTYGGYGLYNASGPNNTLNIFDIGTYALANYANVSELRAFFQPSKLQLCWNSEVSPALLDVAPGFLLGGNGLRSARSDPRLGAKTPLHISFLDKSGDAAVLEWVNTTGPGQWVLRDNPLTVMTNSPQLPEQYALLEQYRASVEPQIEEKSPTTLGSKWWPVPGGWNADTRFQRLWFLNQAPGLTLWPDNPQNAGYSPGSKEYPDSFKALYGAISIINSLVLPQGLDDRGGVGAQGNDSQYTVITTLRDHTTPTLYWRTASNAIWKGLSLADIPKQGDNIKAKPVIDFDMSWYTAIKP